MNSIEDIQIGKEKSFNALLLESINQLIIIIDKNQKIEYVNKASEKLIGIKSFDLDGVSIVELIYPEDREQFLSSLKKINKNKEIKIEIRIINRKGGFIWFSLLAKIFVDTEENEKIICFFTELFPKNDSITKKQNYKKELVNTLTELRFWKLLQPKNSIEAIEESQSMLQFVIDNIPLYIAWKDKNLVYSGCNINYAKIAGIGSPLDIIGMTDFDLNWDEETTLYLYQKEQEVLKEKKEKEHFVESWFEINGIKRWFDTNRIPLYDREKKLVGILITYEDITSRKKSEIKIRESEQKFRDLTELLPDIVFELDSNSKITYLNQVGLKYFGITQSNLHKIDITEIVSKEYEKKIIDNIAKLLEGKKTEPNNYKFISSEGSYFYGLAHSRSIIKNNKITGIRGVIHDITEIIETEEKLKESEKKYRNLAEFLPDIIFEFDKNLNLTYINSAGLKKFGISREEYETGISITSLISSMDRDIALKNIQKTFNGETIEAKDILLKKRNQTYFYGRIHSRPIYKNGEIIGVRGVISDITERKKSEIALKKEIAERELTERKLTESEEKYRHLFETSPNIIWLVAFDGTIIDCNSTINKLLSQNTKEEVIGRNFIDVLTFLGRPDYFISLFKERFSKLRNNQVLDPIEIQIKDLKGKKIWLYVRSSIIKLGNEKLVQVIIQDITKIKKAEEKIRESEEKYRSIFNSSPDFIYLTDINGNIIDANKALLNRRKEDFEKVRGKNFIEFFEKGDKSQLIQSIKKIRDGETVRGIEVESKDANHKKYRYEINAVPLKKNGKISKVLNIARDVTERKLAEEKLKKSQEKLKLLNKELERKVLDRTKELRESEAKLRQQNIKLKELDTIKNEFITNAAHELKTPLISISGYTDFILMKHNENLNPEMRDD
ncbi:MAG: PAS domain S-box protein, partial [Candidatus Lokiarchaeota archaeon]|nr:PAS domain S-box protein [Candidatus Lokiarchaeota archaeon]MBD3202018.1 PAS domain S-box protein [Candidatus Lokiarchaeota archaeon]